ncbi:hypothetical protein IMCC26134_07515 [Verrucomicrobia bacterium IMCC26134]|nr:hypothetical protein IMCC26134_07515 [Verrucomicrobia bacterium IMCC26134]
MSRAPLRIGFVGAGGNTTARHLPGFRALPLVEFRAVANRSTSSAERVAKEWGIARVESDWRSVVEARDIDAICIGTWPDLHAEVALAALAAEKNVLCEARMAATLHEAEAMLASSKVKQGLVAQLVPAPHTLGVDAAVMTWLASGHAGDLRTVEVWDINGAYANPATPITWRLERRYSGVNMLTIGIFYEVLLRWLGADAEVTAVRGYINTARRQSPDGGMREVNLPESLTVEGVFRSLAGAKLRMTHSGLEPSLPRTEIRINGTRGEIRWDGRRGVLETRPATEVGGHDTGWVPLVSAGADAWRVEADFVASVRKGAPVLRTNFMTGLRYMRFTDAVWRALSW